MQVPQSATSVTFHPARIATVDAEDAGQRIDNFLGRVLKGVPKSRLYQMLRRGEVRINGGRAKPTSRVAAGDAVRIPPVHLDPLRPAAGSARLADELERSVLFENDDVLVINKPAGVAVHGGSGVSGAVIETFRAAREQPDLELVHRLDRDTSGCLVIAKKRSALRRLQDDLRAGNAAKQYVALVHGRWQRGKLLIDVPLLRRNRGAERVVTVDSTGVRAMTGVDAVTRSGKTSRLTLDLLTGRTHQIRVHLAHFGHPIIGDDKYGDALLDAAAWQLKVPQRMYLHAQTVGFPGFSVAAPLPEHFDLAFGRLAAR